MKVLSLFDGVSGLHQSLRELNICISEYYASEIDKHAIQISKKNFPSIIQLGDVKNINKDNIKIDIDLLCAGFPCQDLSISKNNREGLDGSRSGLFYEALRLLSELKPRFFLFENVASMSDSDRDKISTLLGVKPIFICSSILTAQSRKRYYWTNIPKVSKPKSERNFVVRDILENEVDAKYFIDTDVPLYFNYINIDTNFIKKPIRCGHFNSGGQGDRIYSDRGKSICLSANGGGRGAKTGLYYISSNCTEDIRKNIRKLTPTECERLQGFPDNFTQNASDSQRYKMLGNSFTIPVIKHILSHI